MYVVDMHCDSIGMVSSDVGLVNNHNFSEKYGQLQFVATFTPKRDTTPEERRRKLISCLDVYISECNRLDIQSVRSCRDAVTCFEDNRRAAIISIEGGGGLFGDSEELNTLYGAGLRVLGLAWDTNELAASAWEKVDTGLTEEGRALAIRASEMGIILDVSHLSDKSFYDLLDTTSYPVIATHSNFRDVTDSKRNLTLDMAKKIAERGGIIGLNLYPGFLSEGETATREDIFRHVDYALTHLGENYLAFGFDIDGTRGSYPEGITEEGSIHDRVIDMLLSRYPERIVEKIAGLNAMEFLKSNL